MEKYKTDFKLKVVKSFLAGEGGAKLLARQWSVPEEKIRTWVSHYRLHGIDGLRPKRSAYSAQFKLLVLSHQDREQLSSRQVVVWRRNLDEGGVEALGNTKQGHPNMKPERRCPAPPTAGVLTKPVAALAIERVCGSLICALVCWAGRRRAQLARQKSSVSIL